LGRLGQDVHIAMFNFCRDSRGRLLLFGPVVWPDAFGGWLRLGGHNYFPIDKGFAISSLARYKGIRRKFNVIEEVPAEGCELGKG
jgi:hypothetical protein